MADSNGSDAGACSKPVAPGEMDAFHARPHTTIDALADTSTIHDGHFWSGMGDRLRQHEEGAKDSPTDSIPDQFRGLGYSSRPINASDSQDSHDSQEAYKDKKQERAQDSRDSQEAYKGKK